MNNKDFIEKFAGVEFNRTTSTFSAFCNIYFPKALQNFADKICKAQRENCRIHVGKHSGGSLKIHRIANQASYAEQPEIEELLTM